ncbi:triphosphoribosyl-dephospho-CoA synthase MdcB [Undibacterium sp. SXout11W]|uniref:triphosphoribosyl-dephospho-CoA synthase MdcB n=1 Tax=Undibacterium sp. SXout11W TaxID=3413050 RepID=UPI003BF1EB48
MQNFFLPASELQHHHALSCKAPVTADISALAKPIAIMALRSLYAELVLYPKPGLVSLRDNGSHTDMTATTFFRSLFSLRHYFLAMANAGIGDGDFQTLKNLGIVAEQQMLRATQGVNTHRGAIFCLGLLCAAAGRCLSQGVALRAQNIRAALLEHWGAELLAHSNAALKLIANQQTKSHGLQVAQNYAISGAREEAAAGFPSVFELALPRLMQSLDQGRSHTEAQIDSLFMLMAHMHDTNLYYRGGVAAAEFSRQSARAFLAAGGTEQTDWLAQAEHCHREFVQRRFSPGGAADLLAASWFIYQVQQMPLPPAYA